MVAGREVVVTRQTPPLAFRATEGGGGRWWQVGRLWVTKSTPPLAFQATEGVVAGGGR